MPTTGGLLLSPGPPAPLPFAAAAAVDGTPASGGRACAGPDHATKTDTRLRGTTFGPAAEAVLRAATGLTQRRAARRRSRDIRGRRPTTEHAATAENKRQPDG